MRATDELHEALAQQRNDAADQAAMLAADLAVERKTNIELRQRIEYLTNALASAEAAAAIPAATQGETSCDTKSP